MSGATHDTANPFACWCRPFCMADGLWIHADERVPLGMAVPIDRLQGGDMSEPEPVDDGHATVLARNTCKHCRRPIAYLVLVGWLHDELAAYAGDPVGCAAPEPVDWICPACQQPRPTSTAPDGVRRVDAHDHRGQLCRGSRGEALPPLSGGEAA